MGWQYAQSYHLRVRLSRPPGCSFPNDILVPNTRYEDVLVLLPSSVQIVVGLAVLAVSVHSGSLSKEKRHGLTDELLARKCALFVNEVGEIRRTIVVAAIHLE